MPNREADAKLEQAEQLSIIAEKIGHTLWQIQELEGVCATYYILMTKATRGMGEEAGNILLKKAKQNTFGSTLRKIKNARLLTTDIEARFDTLLSERNWMVHHSRENSRSAIYNDVKMNTLLDRLQLIADEALLLLKQIAVLAEEHVNKHGIIRQQIEEQVNALLKQWHSS